MAEISIRGSRRARVSAPRPTRASRKSLAETTADRIQPMPTVDEVIAAGYLAETWELVKKERDEFIRRFDADPEFRARAIERADNVHRGGHDGG